MGKALSVISRFIFGHKYLLTLLVFLCIVGFLDENSFYHYYELRMVNSGLRGEIARFEAQYEEARRELHQLQTSQRAYEEVARVRLFMKSDDEDVYIIERK